MKFRRPLTLVALSAAVLAACAPSDPGPDQEAALRVVPTLAAAFGACDPDRVASLYAETAEFLAPDTPGALIGREAIANHLAGACTATYRPIMTVLEQRAHRLGRDGAVITGTYSIGRSDLPDEAPWSAAFVITLAGSADGWRIQTQASIPTGP
ncbi:MAG: SgcJ/EcaC family oxidoreductase [Pseudomonadales bacterium]|nr:SgcJ/EcaC family oxidoreductase [Pseudomonadales bacterium]